MKPHQQRKVLRLNVPSVLLLASSVPAPQEELDSVGRGEYHQKMKVTSIIARSPSPPEVGQSMFQPQRGSRLLPQSGQLQQRRLRGQPQPQAPRWANHLRLQLVGMT